MKFALTLGVAFAAVTLAASADTNSRHVFIRHHGGGDLNIDANRDGWVTRSEASDAFDRAFAHMDRNDDDRITSEDHAALHDFDIRVELPDVRVLEGGDEDGRRVRVIHRGELDEHIEREVERAVREAERAVERAEHDMARAERQAELAERAAERAEHEAERAAERAERHAERAIEEAERRGERVIVIRGHGGGHWTNDDGVVAPIPPVPAVPAVPPHPPMFMMLIANAEEADLNGDGALSREEFRNQHLRFFDASDANGDGRVRFDPTPPTPPTPPAPPEPPRRR